MDSTEPILCERASKDAEELRKKNADVCELLKNAFNKQRKSKVSDKDQGAFGKLDLSTSKFPAIVEPLDSPINSPKRGEYANFSPPRNNYEKGVLNRT